MDRERPIEQLQRDANRRRLVMAAFIGGAIFAIWFLRSLISPSVDRDEIRTAVVKHGEVVASISASGEVVPINEQVISASFESEVVEVIAPVGGVVEMGQPILRLDARALELALADLREELALKENLRRSERLVLDQAVDGYRSRLELLAIDLQSRQAKLTRYQTLAKDGAISNDQLFEAELDVTRTSVEISQLERSIRHAEATAETQLERIDLETGILRNRLEETERQIAACAVSAPRAGVVTWSLEEVGTRVSAGMPLVRVADLTTFRVEAQISDFYATRLSAGLPATVRVNDRQVEGEVSAILPTVESGQMTMQIALADPSQEGLRPRLRVDVEVITGRAQDSLSITNGPSIGSEGRQSVYRIVDGMAERTEVQLGISSRHRVQVLDGLEEGDEVILSDTRDFEHLERIRVE